MEMEFIMKFGIRYIVVRKKKYGSDDGIICRNIY
jgi:hypothetical protein